MRKVEQAFSGAGSDGMLVAMEVLVRPVEASDYEGVVRLAPRLLVGVDPSRPTDLVCSAVHAWVRDSLEAAGTDGRGGWVAVLEESIVGFVSVAEDEHWCGQPDAWVGELMVAERFERQGIARCLIARVEAWASERGLSHVRLSTGAANLGARAFYGRLGYTESDVMLTRQLHVSAAT